jgi:hypothetical protein
MKRNFVISQLFLIFLLVSPVQVFANLELELEIEKSSWAVKENKKINIQIKKIQISVVLGDKFFSIQNGEKNKSMIL